MHRGARGGRRKEQKIAVRTRRFLQRGPPLPPQASPRCFKGVYGLTLFCFTRSPTLRGFRALWSAWRPFEKLKKCSFWPVRGFQAGPSSQTSSWVL